MERLKKRIAKGESEAFVELFDLLGDRLLRYLTARLNPNDAQDVLQEVFIRLVRYHRKLAKSKNLTAYVFLTARNEANRWLAKTGRNSPRQIVHEEMEVAGQDKPIGTRVEHQEFAAQLLAQLTEEEHEIVQLKIYSGLTFAEVSQIVGRPEATVATKYRRAILKMQAAALETAGSQNSIHPRNDRVTNRGD